MHIKCEKDIFFSEKILYTFPLLISKMRVYLLDFFCSSIQFYLLSSPYRCFITILYLDLYVLGDDALIS